MLDSLEFITGIETDYRVEEIKVGEDCVWPFLRIYLAETYNKKGEEVGVVLSWKEKLGMVRRLFYGARNWFKKYDYLFMSSSMERRNIDGIYYDKTVGYTAELLPHSLIIETPVFKHYDIDALDSKNIASSLPLYLLETILIKFTPYKLNTAGEAILSDIVKKHHLTINYRHLAKRFMAQQRVAKFLIRLYKPKAIFLSYSYNKQGYIKVFSSNNIPVVEFQHGLINKTHLAYNVFKNVDASCYPKYLLTMGNAEHDVFSNKNYFIRPENVYPIGNFYIDYINNEFSSNSGQTVNSTVNQIKIAVTLQEEDPCFELIDFIKEVSELDNSVLFLLVPRKKKPEYYQKKYNLTSRMKIVTDMNAYQAIKSSNYHTTIYSTCAIESLSLGVPNIIVDIKGLAKLHIYERLKSNKYSHFVNTPVEYLEVIKKLQLEDISVDEIMKSNTFDIMPHYKKNVKQFLQTIQLG